MAKRFASNSFIAPTRPAQGVSNMNNLTVVFLGSQMLNRAKTFGSHYLLPVAGHSCLLDYQIQELKKAMPKCEFLFIGGFEVDRIIKKRPKEIRLVENPRYEELNQIEEVRLALNNITGNNVVFLTHDAKFNYKSFEGLFAGSATLECPTLVSNDTVGVRSNAGYVECFSYHVETKWPGIVYLCDKELDILRKYSSVKENSKQFLFEGLNHILSQRNIRMVRNNGNTGRITSVEDIANI
jgi:hypothetical protein